MKTVRELTQLVAALAKAEVLEADDAIVGGQYLRLTDFNGCDDPSLAGTVHYVKGRGYWVKMVDTPGVWRRGIKYVVKSVQQYYCDC